MSTIVTTAVAAAAAEGRSTFVDHILNDVVDESQMEVQDEVREFILSDVLRTEEEWQRGIQQNEFDPDLIGRILTEGLTTATRRTASSTLGLEESKAALYEVIHDRWHCPFPFIFC